MVWETRVSADTLIYPIFVIEGENIKEEIPSMPGQYRYSIDRLGEELKAVAEAGVKSILLFGIPKEKDEIGSSAWDENGIVQQALRYGKKEFPNLYYITDVCMCEYTSHGHCGILCDHDVDNDKTLEVLAKTAVSHVKAGADILMVKPGMAYLDIVKEISQNFAKPLAVYSVSDEYAMIKAAATAGYINEEAIIRESTISMYRAGADMLITYFAKEIAQMIKDGKF